MIPYASRTGTGRNLAALREAGWGLLVSAAGAWRDEGFAELAADNGQWTERGTDNFDEERFLRFTEWLPARARFLVLPDIVAGGMRSLDLSLAWLERMAGAPWLLLIAVQDGIEPSHVEHLLGERVGLFVGGTTEWKEATMRQWGELAHLAGCWLHVGRVNTARRMFLAIEAGADSVDGTSATKFATTLPMLRGAARHRDLFAVGGGE